MSDIPDFIDISALEQLADESGFAVALVDETGEEVAVANNNSICEVLNPLGYFSPDCAAYCGQAFDRTVAGGPLSYVCHAGLDCRTAMRGGRGVPLVAIVGRAFTEPTAFPRAVERVFSGDWQDYSPVKFFENIIMTGSAEKIDRLSAAAATVMKGRAEEEGPREAPRSAENLSRQLTTMVERFNREITRDSEPTSPAEVVTPAPDTSHVPERRTGELGEWRALFGSLLQKSYGQASAAIIEFLNKEFNLPDLAWFDRKAGALEGVVPAGPMSGRRIRIGLDVAGERLIQAANAKSGVEFGELSRRAADADVRTLTLFPIGVGDEVSAAIGVLGSIDDIETTARIGRLAHSIATQIVILRLRTEVETGQSLNRAVRKFTDSLSTIDTADIWLNLTQNAAETLRAERASLMIFDAKADALKIKAIIGTAWRPSDDERVGERVAHKILVENRPAAVADVSLTSLPPLGEERHYKTPSFLSCPISVAGRAVAVLNFTDRACGRAFDASSVELFQAIAPQLAVVVDRAHLKESVGELTELSNTDPLTGLLNRRYIDTRLIEELKRSSRHGFPMSFMMLDVDNFKSYNDSFGHKAGDAALSLVGRVIRETLRDADIAARWGGEEFSILLPQTNKAEAAIIAERIRVNIETTAFSHRRVTTSIGVATCTAELCLSDDVVEAADRAMYQAKNGGRNRVVVHGSKT